MILVIVGGAYYVYTQPTEFDEFLEAQQSFVNDLYDGTLLADFSQANKDSIDSIIPDFDDLVKMQIEDDVEEECVEGQECVVEGVGVEGEVVEDEKKGEVEDEKKGEVEDQIEQQDQKQEPVDQQQ